jgi:baculoviral IAP repeat-containing protein 6
MFLVFSLLCGLEPSQSTTPSSPKKRAKFRKGEKLESSSGTAQPENTGAKSRSKSLHTHLSKGTGYGDQFVDGARSTGRSQTWQAVDDDTDDLRLRFEALSMILPSGIKGTTPFDCLPNPTVSEMIRRSPMLQHASELLRHASIEEINKRCGPIITVLDFLETAASHFSTCPLLLRERTLFPPTEQLAHVAFKGTKNQSAAGAASYETAQPLAAIVELLAVPCRRFVETSRRLGNMNVEEGEGDLLAVVERICGIADGLGALRAQLPRKEPQDVCEPSSSSSSRPTANVTTRGMRANADKTAEDTATQEVARTVSEWHRANCVKEVPDDVILDSSCYGGEARKADNSKPAPGRMRKLLAQVSSLSTDLPDGIYVRHGESRVDVLKVLIVGPTDTPYEHGLFEFDMLVGPEFPQFPPKMYFRTTGGGRARFNPNLYVNGKGKFRPSILLRNAGTVR